MRFIDLPTFGDPQVMRLQNMDKPEPALDEVLIRVSAAGVNRPDIVQRQGYYPPPPGASPVLGLEVAGEIVAIGEKVKRWNVGDQVCALTNGGGYAEFTVAPEEQCLSIPVGLSMEEAAALPETFFTVWANVFERAHLKRGEIILVHGGSSGIGTTAIQLAHNFGVRVFTTAGTAEKCAACEELGAERAINYREEDFVSIVREATAGHGADVILDMVGGSYISSNIRAAAHDGRIVNIAYLAGANVEINMMPVMLKRLTLTGSTLRARSAEVKAGIATALQREVWPLIEAGKIRPQIAAKFPLEQVVEAHKLLESGTIVGKVILTV
ncbi:NAD(P)H-quinone oxidoreductase [Microbulbifer sp. OS29]|uniref:NAD(P)H-quinone oxidoreductase n=1 Tax=Microbulbifer okhotskensis TaxID=2926617 RepID=A0A9X2J5B6_9GAMM|nr:NAD(P)H-quinone oxidoreductase [Microbulbifer okhotskensis]MCO1335038.1 NAD(P)H-quinone oxidoreductase [Microbulbifer okhotskensis]